MPYSAPEYTHSPCLISPNLICIYYSIYSLFHSPHHSVPQVQPRISCYSIRWQSLSHRNTRKNITLDSSVSLWVYFPNFLCFFVLFFFFVCFVSLSMGFSFLSEDVFGLGGEDCCQSLNCLRRSTTSVIPEQEGISPGKGYPTPIPSEVYLADALLPGGQTLMLLLSMCNRYSRTAQQSFPSATSAPNHLQLPQRPPPQINWTLGLCQQASSLISWFLISFHLYPGK